MKYNFHNKGWPLRLQKECLRARKKLFQDSKLGFDYSFAGVRTKAQVEKEEKKIQCKFRDWIDKIILASHRHLIIYMKGESSPLVLHTSNEYGSFSKPNNKDSQKNNPYNRIANSILTSMKNNKRQSMDIKDVALAIQQEAVKYAAKLVKKNSSADKLIKEFTSEILRLTNSEITLSFKYTRNVWKVNFSTWDLYKQTHKQHPGKYKVDEVAKVILETYSHSKSQVSSKSASSTAPVTAVPVSAKSSTKNALSYVNAITECVVALHKEFDASIPVMVDSLSQGYFSASLSDGTISFRCGNCTMSIDTCAKTNEDIRKEVSAVVSKLLLIATIDFTEEIRNLVDVGSLQELFSQVCSCSSSIVEATEQATVISELKPVTMPKAARPAKNKAATASKSIGCSAPTKFNRLLADKQSDLTDAATDGTVDTKNLRNFSAWLGREVTSIAKQVGLQGYPFKFLTQFMDSDNKKYFRDLYDVCGLTIPQQLVEDTQLKLAA